MSARTAVLAVGLSLLAAGPAAAGKPPGLPGDPRGEGRELTPVQRTFYLPAAETRGEGVVGPVGGRPMTRADLAAWQALNRLPVGLLGLALPALGWD